MSPRTTYANASWLLAGGADLQVVKERLGHASIATTEQYLYTLPNADETALAALEKIRGPQINEAPETSGLDALMAENERLRAALADVALALRPESRPHLSTA